MSTGAPRGLFGFLANPTAGADAAPESTGTFPMPVADFIAADYLRWSDIVLTRREWTPLSWLIRYATRSNFAHAALVFLTPKWQLGWRSTYIIESVFSGVEVTDLADYSKYSRLSLAVKRVNHGWFDDRVRKRVRGRMLDDIKAEYAFSTLFGLGRQFVFGVESAVRGHKQTVLRRRELNKRAAKEFICSGFIQRGYAQGVYEFIRDGVVPTSAFKDIIFDRTIASMLPDDWSEFTPAEQADIVAEFIDAFQDHLFAVTPRDIETHAASDWIYVLHDGLAYEVSSYDEVCAILKMKPSTP